MYVVNTDDGKCVDRPSLFPVGFNRTKDVSFIIQEIVSTIKNIFKALFRSHVTDVCNHNWARLDLRRRFRARHFYKHGGRVSGVYRSGRCHLPSCRVAKVSMSCPRSLYLSVDFFFRNNLTGDVRHGGKSRGKSPSKHVIKT